MEYTPGYWFVSTSNSSLITANNGELHNWQMNNVCQVYGMPDEQREANAKLIAAAPEMANALKAFICAFNSTDKDRRSRLLSACNQAKAIIEKATK